VSWEKNQDWSGVMLTGSAMTFMNRHRVCRDQAEGLLFRLDKPLLPLRTDPPRSIRAGVVLPHVRREEDYGELARILRELGLESCNLDVQRKLEATANLFDSDEARQPT